MYVNVCYGFPKCPIFLDSVTNLIWLNLNAGMGYFGFKESLSFLAYAYTIATYEDF